MQGCSWSVPKKRDQAKNKALQIYFPKILSFEHKKLYCSSLL